MINKQLCKGDRVTVDLSNTVLTTSFVNHAFGQLLRDRTPDELNQQIEFVGVDGYRDRILRACLKNARNFYGRAAQ